MQQHATRLRKDNPQSAGAFQHLPGGADELRWSAQDGYGYFEIREPAPYDQAYYDKYVGYARTDLGRALTRMRVALVRRYVEPEQTIVDIGIGSGHFLRSMRRHYGCFGFDVNPVAVACLQERDWWLDPYNDPVDVLTLWDSFEHIQCPALLLRRRPAFVFMSLPVFRDRAHVLRSKHFRRDEHWWYFTSWGLIHQMDLIGYRCLAMNDDETRAGREDISTFAFARLTTQEMSDNG